MNELVLTGTLFFLTRVLLDGVTRNPIDTKLVNKRSRNSEKGTRVYRSADIGSDHYLVFTSTKLSLKSRQTRNRVLELNRMQPS